MYTHRNKYNQTHYDHDNPPPKIVQAQILKSLLSSGFT